MPFPISINGAFEVDLPKDDDKAMEAVEAAVEAWLVKEHARDIVRAENALSFKAGILHLLSISRRSGWGLLFSIRSGRIGLAQDERSIRLTYHFSLIELLVYISLVVALLVLPLAWDYPILVLIFWLWLLGANYALTWVRVPSALRSAVREALPSPAR